MNTKGTRVWCRAGTTAALLSAAALGCASQAAEAGSSDEVAGPLGAEAILNADALRFSETPLGFSGALDPMLVALLADFGEEARVALSWTELGQATAHALNTAPVPIVDSRYTFDVARTVPRDAFAFWGVGCQLAVAEVVVFETTPPSELPAETEAADAFDVVESLGMVRDLLVVAKAGNCDSLGEDLSSLPEGMYRARCARSATAEDPDAAEIALLSEAALADPATYLLESFEADPESEASPPRNCAWR